MDTAQKLCTIKRQQLNVVFKNPFHWRRDAFWIHHKDNEQAYQNNTDCNSKPHHLQKPPPNWIDHPKSKKKRTKISTFFSNSYERLYLYIFFHSPLCTIQWRWYKFHNKISENMHCDYNLLRFSFWLWISTFLCWTLNKRIRINRLFFPKSIDLFDSSLFHMKYDSGDMSNTRCKVDLVGWNLFMPLSIRTIQHISRLQIQKAFPVIECCVDMCVLWANRMKSSDDSN